MELKNCPFCGGKGVMEHDSGSWGYTPPKCWVACENSIFPKTSCGAKTRCFEEDRWEPGKGTYSILEQARRSATEMWNRRV